MTSIKFNGMRDSKSFFILFLMIAASLLAYAEQSSGNSKSRLPITLRKGNGHGHVDCPKAPDRQLITCSYNGMTLEMDFTISEGISTLTVTDETPQCVSYTIDTSTLYVSVPVGTLYGTINIELDTERGNHFTGVME